jgi:hypothetical protein
MNHTKKLLLIMLLACNQLIAQNLRKEKFGNIKIEDFSPVSPILTPDDDAIILYDIGSTVFEGNNQGGFDLLYKHHKKILIKKRSAFDLATIQERLYNGDYESEERLEDVKAATYNIVDGKIVTSNLEVKKDVAKEQLNKSTLEKKFTLPEVKEGCIVEYSYTVRTKNVGDMHGWDFQDVYPTLWSEYHVVIPPMYSYLQQRRGLGERYDIDSFKTVYQNYSIIVQNDYGPSDHYNFSGDAKWALWVRKDVPAFKREDFTSSLRNYLSSIEFHYFSFQLNKESPVKLNIKDWLSTASSYLNAPNFGAILNLEKNEWVATEAKKIVGTSIDEEAAKKVYNYFKENFNCISKRGTTFSNEPKKIWQNKKGRVSDINLLMNAFLFHLGFKTSPVILSTQSNGRPDEVRAITYQFNYVIAELEIKNKKYLLDATNKYLGFGQIPEDCYGGSGRKIERIPILIPLNADSLVEAKSTSIFIVNSETKGKLEASFTTNLGVYESAREREKYNKEGKDNYFSKFEKAYTFPVKISKKEIENETELADPFILKYDFETELGDEDIIYFSPLLAEATTKNPFKSATRNYPVEMPYAQDNTVVLDMEIPKGYEVDELPESLRATLLDDAGKFEYIIVKRDNKIQLRNRILINKANFETDEYEVLRNFWAMIVKKHAEQIVFKKIK